MSIRPIRFNTDGSVDIWHDERQHGGTVSAANVKFTARSDGSPNYDFIVLPCPVAGCISESIHPVSGGAAPEEVQMLFAHAYRRDRDLPDTNTWETAVGRVRERVEALDGANRFRLAGRTESVQLSR